MVHSQYSRLDISKSEEASRYKFMMGTVIPRPVGLVTSLSRDGVPNAAPFGQFVVISVVPPLPGFVAHEGEYSLKDTVRTTPESDEYVINTVAESITEQVEVCAGNFPPSVSEVDEIAFRTLLSTFVRPARIAKSPIRLEYRPHPTVECGDSGSGTHLAVGEVIATHCADGVVSGHRVSPQAISAVGRIAGRGYRRAGDKFDG